MQNRNRTKSEALLGIVPTIAGLITAIALAAPFDKYSFVNFLWYWGPSAIALSGLYLFRIRPVVIGGVALGMAAHLLAFALWVAESMGWIIHFFSLPAGGVAVVGIGIASRTTFKNASPTLAFVATFVVTTATLAAAHFGVIFWMENCC